MMSFRTNLYISLLLLLCSSSVTISLPHNNSTPNPYLTQTTLFLQNYQKMVQNFKVFMYEPNITQFKFGTQTQVESLFYSSLRNSSYITQHPEEANLFFLPFASDISTRSLARVVSRIRNDFPYWNRTLGADHFYLSCTGILMKNDRNLVELKKNAVQISCFPTRQDRFVPHKDLTLPPLRNSHAPVKLGSGEFCVVDCGNDDVLSLGEALRLGCVPVVVTEGPLNDMPFVDVLRWRKMAVFVKSYVKDDTDTWRERHEFMKRLGVVASKHLQWNRSPIPFDAFNTIMYQLWLRRHTVRYERESPIMST
ncbi:probable glycosyltransferase At5g20260 [Cicer arietinum]|uniref:Probable glycosyltransferase At5g20260 n=1 Tax=Cicer arietinum TaxID=3827 RepID=A0A1S2YGH3_CICAR|nr:probable glycosyltransferase At5g20260 [Cicer arietinum]